ncbi:MAG: hypothetical protein AAFZ52_01650 [Bacteroidota bacterium]
MKYFLSLLAGCLLLACQPEKKKDRVLTADELVSTAAYVASPDQATSDYTPLYIHQIPQDKDLDAKVTPVGQYGQLMQPPMDKFESQVLTSGIWTFEFYLDDDASVPQKIAATGQWLQFFPDGTFKGGHWERQTHSGAWYPNYLEKDPVIQLDSNVDRLDAKWQIQSIGGDQEQMGWVRMPIKDWGPYHRSIPAKLIKLTSRPTRQQFARQLGGL